MGLIIGLAVMRTFLIRFCKNRLNNRDDKNEAIIDQLVQRIKGESIIEDLVNKIKANVQANGT